MGRRTGEQNDGPGAPARAQLLGRDDELDGLQQHVRGRTGPRLRRGRSVSYQRNSIFFMGAIYGRPSWYSIVGVGGGGKRLPSGRFRLSRAGRSGTYRRYTQPTAVVRKTLILLSFSRRSGEELRVPPSPPYRSE